MSDIFGPQILPFKPKPVDREPKTFAQCVGEQFLKEAAGVEGVTILYKTSKGEYKVMSDQGDIAAALLLVERTKMSILR